MSKGNSGLFHGTLGTTRINSTQETISYSDRNIEIPEHIKDALSKLKNAGDVLIDTPGKFSMMDASIMSKETGVEFAHLTIGNKSYLIRGTRNSTPIPNDLEEKLKREKGTLDFHSHPHDDDCIPSEGDKKKLEAFSKRTGQKTSKIVTPNGRTVLFDKNGVLSTGTVPNLIDESLKKALYDLWR